MDSDESPSASELAPITGRVKWFDATRGFGFLVSEEIDGDVLLHFSVLREHGRRRGPQAKKIPVSRVFFARPPAPALSNSPPQPRGPQALGRCSRRVRAGGGQM